MLVLWGQPIPMEYDIVAINFERLDCIIRHKFEMESSGKFDIVRSDAIRYYLIWTDLSWFTRQAKTANETKSNLKDWEKCIRNAWRWIFVVVLSSFFSVIVYFPLMGSIWMCLLQFKAVFKVSVMIYTLAPHNWVNFMLSICWNHPQMNHFIHWLCRKVSACLKIFYPLNYIELMYRNTIVWVFSKLRIFQNSESLPVHNCVK